jgi:two-component system, OmpR family, sensor histidine kinase QseC
MNSIKSYLISWILGIVILGVLIISFISYQETKHEIEELFDAELVKTAKIFLRFLDLKVSKQTGENSTAIAKKNPRQESMTIVFDLSAKLTNTTEMPSHIYEGKIAFRVYNNQYHLLAESVNSPKFLPNKLEQGFITQTIESKKWHLFVLYEKNKQLWLVTAQHDAIRQELVENILSFLILPSLIGMPILIFLIWFFLGKGLKPLNLMAQAIARRHPEHLDPPSSSACTR